jgi:hypothetical protein
MAEHQFGEMFVFEPEWGCHVNMGNTRVYAGPGSNDVGQIEQR